MVDIKTGKNLTRRDLLKYASITIGGAALSASGEQFWLPRENWCRTNAVGSANASVGGMMRNVGGGMAARFGGGKPTAKNYVQDGLIAMWDGIENAGWGVHNESLTTWKNLINGEYTSFYGNVGAYFGDDCCVFANSVSTGGIIIGNEWNAFTIQVLLGNVANVFLDSSADNFYTQFGRTSYQSKFGKLRSNNTIAFIGWDINAVNTFVNADDFIGYHSSTYGWQKNQATTPLTTISEVVTVGSVADASIATGMKIRSIRVYNRALTDAEIAANYAIDKARFNLP